MNTDKTAVLYEKMAAEQDKFRDWLKSQPPEEILNHAYRHSREEMRELLAAKANVDRILNMEAEHDAEKEKDHGQR